MENLRENWVKFLNQWDWEWFVTLTFADDISVHTAGVRFKRWFRMLNRRRDNQVGYFMATEWHKNRKVPHFHLLMLGVGNSRRLTWMDKWYPGYARIWPYNKNKGAAHYLTKYITKELADYQLGGVLLKT